MKKVYIVLAFVLCSSVALAFAGSPAHAQTPKGAQAANTVHRPLSTIPYCYGDGLPHNNPPIQPCDGLLYQNPTLCPGQGTVQTKPIGSSDGEGQIGTLYLQNSSGVTGCNDWWAAIKIIHSGCFFVYNDQLVETGADVSIGEPDVSLPRSVCQNQWVNSYTVGDWQPGGCYYAISTVKDAHGNSQNTSTSTYCL